MKVWAFITYYSSYNILAIGQHEQKSEQIFKPFEFENSRFYIETALFDFQLHRMFNTKSTITYENHYPSNIPFLLFFYFLLIGRAGRNVLYIRMGEIITLWTDWVFHTNKMNNRNRMHNWFKWNNEVIQLEQTTTDIFLDADLFTSVKPKRGNWVHLSICYSRFMKRWS